MQGAKLAFNPRANVWQAWLGFNLSHTLGLVVFGGGVLGLGWHHFEVFAGSLVVQALTLLVAASYFVLSVRLWLWGPAVGSGAAVRDVNRLAGHACVQLSDRRAADERNLPAGARRPSLRPHGER